MPTNGSKFSRASSVTLLGHESSFHNLRPKKSPVEHETSRYQQKNPAENRSAVTNEASFLRSRNSRHSVGQTSGQVDRGRGVRRFRPVYADREVGGMVGGKWPRNRAGRTFAFDIGERRARASQA